MKDGNFDLSWCSDDINGMANPTLHAKPGETITVTLINGGRDSMTLRVPDVKASTGVVKEKGEDHLGHIYRPG